MNDVTELKNGFHVYYDSNKIYLWVFCTWRWFTAFTTLQEQFYLYSWYLLNYVMIEFKLTEYDNKELEERIYIFICLMAIIYTFIVCSLVYYSFEGRMYFIIL